MPGEVVNENGYDKRWWVLGVLCLSLVMVVLANTVLNVAIPTLVREIGADSSELQWMVDSYALVFAGLLLTAGALGDRFGRKGALVVGLVIFGAASVASTFATSAGHLIATRAVMGLGAALVMPATLSILTSVFPPHERARAIGTWAGFAGAGAAIGPIAAGWLLEHFYWGSVFFINVPIVVIALVAGYLIVPTSRDPGHTALDPVGAFLSIVGFGALLYAVIEAPVRGWTDPITLTALAFGAIVLMGFGAWELRSEHPMLDLRFFRDPRFSSASAAISLVFFAMFGSFFLLTQYLQVVREYTPLQAGFRTLPMALTMMVVAPASARFVERFGARAVVSSGLGVVAAGLALFSLVGISTPYALFALILVVLAFGMSISMAPATASIMASLPMAKAGVGSAWNDTTRELGGAFGVAVLGSVMASQYGSAVADKLGSLPPAAASVARGSVGAAVEVAGGVGGRAGEVLADGARAAFVSAMSVSLLVAAFVALVAAALVGRFMPGRVPATEGPAEIERLEPAVSQGEG